MILKYEIVGMNRLQEHPSSYAIDFKLLVYRSPTGGFGALCRFRLEHAS
jgi:hypothetical protein